ncbi:MOSC domain-containing protein [Actinotalea sp. JY-7885]|uniref:MOSC domain-containing protein n=1 Tax=Actinotalea sp. JY-7885 TaxID=2758576 RepID=UPI00165EA529|nr:MOSC N-terminal beta barrel domain-containing protein [Actinotalea sp. JY-7885]
MQVTSLAVYPVKSLGGVPVDSARVQPWGLEHDRRWMVVDEAGAKVSAIAVGAMVTITATPRPDGGLLLARDGAAPLTVPVPVDGPRVEVTLSRVGTAHAADDAAHAWLSEALGRRVRLVWLDDPRRRAVTAEHGGRPGDVLSLADTGPLLLTSTSSLARLDRWVAQTWADRYAQCGAAAGSRPGPLAMTRFRPNLVVTGDLEPFAEDSWLRITVGDVELRVSEHCDRCAVTTIDPATGARGHEPLRTLAAHRRRDGKVWFGVRAVPVSTGTVRLGDRVEVVRSR